MSLNRSSATTAMARFAPEQASARAEAETISSGALSGDAGMLACLHQRIAHVEIERLLGLQHRFEQSALRLVLDIADRERADAHRAARLRRQRRAVVHRTDA